MHFQVSFLSRKRGHTLWPRSNFLFLASEFEEMCLEPPIKSYTNCDNDTETHHMAFNSQLT